MIPDESEFQFRFLVVIKRKQHKQSGAISSKSGKNRVTLNGYKTVCVLGFYGSNVDLWCLSIFCWNLVARGEPVRHLCYEHIEWESDCLRH